MSGWSPWSDQSTVGQSCKNCKNSRNIGIRLDILFGKVETAINSNIALVSLDFLLICDQGVSVILGTLLINLTILLSFVDNWKPLNAVFTTLFPARDVVRPEKMMKALEEEEREANNNNNNNKTKQVDDVSHLPKARQQLLEAYSAPVTRIFDSSSSIISSISTTAASLPIIGNYLPGQKSVGWIEIYSDQPSFLFWMLEILLTAFMKLAINDTPGRS